MIGSDRRQSQILICDHGFVIWPDFSGVSRHVYSSLWGASSAYIPVTNQSRIIAHVPDLTADEDQMKKVFAYSKRLEARATRPTPNGLEIDPFVTFPPDSLSHLRILCSIPYSHMVIHDADIVSKLVQIELRGKPTQRGQGIVLISLR